MNEKLAAIAQKASADVAALIKEAEEKILEAWNQCEAEAQEQETAPKFKLAFGITLDLDKDTMETALSFGVKHKLTANAQIPDPSQPGLPLEGHENATVRITGNGIDTGEIPAAKFSQMAKRLRKAQEGRAE